MQQSSTTQQPDNSPRLRLERERRGHDAFARTRRRAYVENREILERIDRWAIGSDGRDRLDRPLVVTGEPGSGKSALLAHWAARFETDHPKTLLLSHFVGAGTFGSDLTGLLRHLMHDLKERLDIPEELAEDPERLPDQFLGWVPWLHGKRVVIVVDALNQLSGEDDPKKLLGWIPGELDNNLRILLSTLRGPLLDEIRSREWNELHVEPLSEAERREVARRFIGGESRFSNIRSGQIKQIANSRRSANPLFLRTSLEELRLRDRAKPKSGDTGEYLEADSLLTLFDRILERIESEFGLRLVSTAMRMIDASRNGLSREELADLCGVRTERIDKLLAALDYQLIRRDQLYTFFHDHLRQAVVHRYASSAQSRSAAHRRLGAYFKTHERHQRRAEEELHAWKQAGRFNELKESITDLDLVGYLWNSGQKYEVIEYWKDINEVSPTSIEEAYREPLQEVGRAEDRAAHLHHHETISQLSFDLAMFAETERILLQGLERVEEEEIDQKLRIRLRRQLGKALRESARWEEAEEILLDILAQAEDVFGFDSRETALILDDLATVYYHQYDFKRALDLHQRAWNSLRSLLGEDHVDAINAQINIAACYHGLQQYDHLNDLYKELLDRCERNFADDHPLTALVLHNHGMALQRQDRHSESRPILKRSLEIIERTYGKDHLEVAHRLRGLSTVDREAGDYEEAIQKSRRAVDILTKTYGPNHPDVASIVNAIATIYGKIGDYKRSEEHCRKALAIRKECYPAGHSSIHRAKLNLGNTLIKQKRVQEALPLFESSAVTMAKLFGRENKWSRIWVGRYIEVLRALGRDEEAQDMEREWID